MLINIFYFSNLHEQHNFSEKTDFPDYRLHSIHHDFRILFVPQLASSSQFFFLFSSSKATSKANAHQAIPFIERTSCFLIAVSQRQKKERRECYSRCVCFDGPRVSLWKAQNIFLLLPLLFCALSQSAFFLCSFF